MRLPLPILGLVIVSTLSCEQRTIRPSEQAGLVEPTIAAGLSGDPESNKELGAAKRATAHYHRVAAAVAAGYEPITPCVEQLPEGAQGIHYGNVALIDGTVDAEAPEVLQYEPQKNGRLRLVGIEYLVPLSFDEPDPIFGQHFHANAAIGLWALHVWAWRHNPDGMFKDWNPNVSCAHAD